MKILIYEIRDTVTVYGNINCACGESIAIVKLHVSPLYLEHRSKYINNLISLEKHAQNIFENCLKNIKTSKKKIFCVSEGYGTFYHWNRRDIR